MAGDAGGYETVQVLITDVVSLGKVFAAGHIAARAEKVRALICRHIESALTARQTADRYPMLQKVLQLASMAFPEHPCFPDHVLRVSPAANSQGDAQKLSDLQPAVSELDKEVDFSAADCLIKIRKLSGMLQASARLENIGKALLAMEGLSS